MSNTYPRVIQVPTTDGIIEARKDTAKAPWDISHPWGDARIYGDKTAVMREILRIVERCSGELVEEQPCTSS